MRSEPGDESSLDLEAAAAQRLQALVMITGATISSRAVIKAINTTLERVGPLLAAYDVQEPRP